MVKLLEFLDRHTARHLFRSSHLNLPLFGNVIKHGLLKNTVLSIILKLFAEMKRLLTCKNHDFCKSCNHSRIQIIYRHYRHCLSFWRSDISIFEHELKLLKLIWCKFYTKCDDEGERAYYTASCGQVADLRSILRYCRFITYHFTV